VYVFEPKTSVFGRTISQTAARTLAAVFGETSYFFLMAPTESRCGSGPIKNCPTRFGSCPSGFGACPGIVIRRIPRRSIDSREGPILASVHRGSHGNEAERPWPFLLMYAKGRAYAAGHANLRQVQSAWRPAVTDAERLARITPLDRELNSWAFRSFRDVADGDYIADLYRAVPRYAGVTPGSLRRQQW
jgi:hypothetical protein